MLDQVPEHHVAATGRQPGPREILGGRHVYQSFREAVEDLERVEDLAIPGRLGTATLDDVSAIGPVGPGRMHKLPAGCKRLVERFLQLTGFLHRENQGPSV